MMEESELLELKDELEKKKNGIGLVGVRLNVGEGKGESLSAHITTDWKEILISYGRDLELVPDAETKNFVRKKGIENVIMKVGEDILDHEAGHRENRVGEGFGCPHDIEMHDEIKDGVARGLKKIGKEGLESYVTNAFEDVIDNVNCRRFGDFAGQTLFWNNQGIVNSREQKFNPFYEAFIRINLFLGGNVSDYGLLKRYFGFEEKVGNAVSEYLDVFRREFGLGKKKNLLKLHERKGFDKLFSEGGGKRKELWKNLGYEFAVKIGVLLDEVPKERMFGSSDGDENSEDQNPFDREMKIPGNRQKISFVRYKEGKGPVEHRELEEQLYDLYKAESKEIPVETSEYRQSSGMPLVKFGRRFVREGEQKFRFRGVGFDSEGQLGLRTTKHFIEYPVSYKKSPGKFPKFKLAKVDRSSSMLLNSDNEIDSDGNPINIGDTLFIPWGDNSKYHYTLKGIFGIENFFERQGIASYIDNCVLGFSGEEAVRGDFDKVAKSLLAKPIGGTSLDINGLERELEEGAFVVSISDGEFSFGEESKKRLESRLGNCDYAHMQIGGETAYSVYIRNLGRPVIMVKGDDDLSNAMVSFVSGYYRDVGGDLEVGE